MKRLLLTLLLLALTPASVYAGNWQKVNEGWSYIEDDGNVKRDGWLTDTDGKRYNFSGGIARTGVWFSGSKIYCFNQNSGELMQGFVNIGGKGYFLGRDGSAQTQWISAGGRWYYGDSDGSLHVGILSQGSDKYYFHEDGHMAVSEWVNDNTYYASANGKIAKSQWIDSETYVGSSGKVSDSEKKSRDKKKIDNKTFSNAEYAGMVTDNLNRYVDDCEDLISSIQEYRVEWNEKHVYNYEGDDDDYAENHELPEFISDSTLSEAATLRAVELASQQRASGARPDGRSWDTVVIDRGVDSHTNVDESVAFGQDDSKYAYEDMKDGSSHSKIWENKTFTRIGAGAACDIDGRMYYVVLYTD